MFDVLAELEEAIDKVAASESHLDVERVCRLAERVEFLRLRAVGEYDRSGRWQAEGFQSSASALRTACRMSEGAARGAIDLARKLWVLPVVAEAFGAGAISRQHAAVIAAAHTHERAAAFEAVEGELVDVARSVPPRVLGGVVRSLTDAFDRDGGAARDGEQYARNRLSVSVSFEGRGMLDGSLDGESTEIVTSALDAMIGRLHRKGDRRPRPVRRAEALVELCRRSADHDYDDHSRSRRRPHLSAVFDVRALESDRPALVADVRFEAEHVGQLSRCTLERLMCDCELSRVITDGPSKILDVGRETRSVSWQLWNALVVRDRHCREPGCDRPPGFCEAHHVRHWEHGGPTDLANLELLCWQHHRARHVDEARAPSG